MIFEGPETSQGFRDGTNHAAPWSHETARRSLDELFSLACQYQSSAAYRQLLEFIARFRFYSPYNALLLHIQRPGATFVAPPTRWLQKYGRRIKPGAAPLVILQPGGPVMFVFDVSDTAPEEGAAPLPPEVERPFEVQQGRVGTELTFTIENAKRDGVAVSERPAGSQSAGCIGATQSAGLFIDFIAKEMPELDKIQVPLRYDLLLNSQHSPEAKYATLVHELGHLYCGHLGSPNPKWWPDRRGLAPKIKEFEAESICYLVCERLGIKNPSAEYLANYERDNRNPPHISLDCVMKVAGLIEHMGRARLRPRKTSESAGGPIA